MDSEKTMRLARIISEGILTPIIYMLEDEDRLSFVCFCDRHITMQEIYDIEQRLEMEAGMKSEIIDIREYGETERVNVLNDYTLIYSEHPLLEKILTQTMIEEFRIAMSERKDVLARQKESGTYYLQ